MSENHLSEAACCIVELSQALNVTNIKDLPGAWLHEWKAPDGKTWAVAANGHKDKILSVGPKGGMDVNLDSFHFAVWRNGFLFGLLTPFAGTFMGHNGIGEDEFIDAIKAHIATFAPGSEASSQKK